MLLTHGVYGAAAAISFTAVTAICSLFDNSATLSIVVNAIVLLILLISYVSRWKIARPDEWQLHIRNGQLLHAGVAATHFLEFFDRIVRFPSCIQKVQFQVEQVTKEMQGVVVSGFALWSVHREGDGPWRAYKNLVLRDKDRDGKIDSEAGNNHIRDMVQSIIRVSIAQQNLTDCLTKRDEIRETVRDQMMKQLPGWGVWLETVEISDVRVSSSALFNDLQAEFRSSQRLSAERVRLATERQLLHEKLEADLEENRKRVEAESDKAIVESEQRLRREKKQAELLQVTQEVQAQRLEREKAMRLAELETDHAVEMARVKNGEMVETAQVEKEVRMTQLRDKRMEAIGDRQLQILQIEAMKEIYNKVGPINVNAFTGVGTGASDGEGSGLGLLPGLAAAAHTWEVVKGKK